MKKKTRRKLKKGARKLSEAVQKLSPMLAGRAGAVAGGGVAAGGLLLAATRDPAIRESAKALVSALGGFLKRSLDGADNGEGSAGSQSESRESSVEHH
jgi:hypothetical protein